MNKTTIALSILFVALAAAVLYFHIENRRLNSKIDEFSVVLVELRADSDQLREQVEIVQSNLDDVRIVKSGSDWNFPGNPGQTGISQQGMAELWVMTQKISV